MLVVTRQIGEAVIFEEAMQHSDGSRADMRIILEGAESGAACFAVLLPTETLIDIHDQNGERIVSFEPSSYPAPEMYTVRLSLTHEQQLVIGNTIRLTFGRKIPRNRVARIALDVPDWMHIRRAELPVRHT